MQLRLTHWPKRNGYSTKDQNAQTIGHLKDSVKGSVLRKWILAKHIHLTKLNIL